MPVTLNGATLAYALAPTFCYSDFFAQSPISHVRLYGGTQPANPTITSGTTQLSGNAALTAANWNAPAAGVVTLSGAVEITPNATGTVTFIRLMYGTNSLMDIPVATTAGSGNARLSTLSAVSGTPLQLLDLRIKLNTVGAMSVSPPVANYFLMSLCGMANPFTGTGADINFLGAASSYRMADDNSTGTLLTLATTVSAYSGTVPASATAPLSGNTLLWQKSLSGAGDMFEIAGTGLTLTEGLSANAAASGTPTFIRIVRPEIAYTDSYFDTVTTPQCTIQIPVGDASSGCSFSPTTLTSGASASLVQCTINLAS